MRWFRAPHGVWIAGHFISEGAQKSKQTKNKNESDESDQTF